MKTLLNKYPLDVNNNSIQTELNRIKELAESNTTPEVLKTCLSLIDLTTLNSTDTVEKVKELTEKVNNFEQHYPNCPNVAAICVYPSLASTVKQTLKAKDVQIAVVSAGFPASQTFIEVKVAECIQCIKAGADELDIVISLGSFLAGDYNTVANEIAEIKKVIGKAHLKVILETGAINNLSKIRIASLLAMEAGADVIKTSTGKLEPAASPEAFLVMCQAVKDYNVLNRRMVGLKPAGGIVSTSDALLYYSIVKSTLGEAWLTPNYFRIGASRLANNLLSDISNSKVTYF